MGSRLNNKDKKNRDDDSLKRKSGIREEYTEDRIKKICFNFEYLDRNQGQDYKEWEKEELLALMLDKFTHLCGLNIMSQKGILKIYGDFPEKSNFTYPKHIPENVNWSSIRVQAEERVIGFIKDNIFYIVFLDKNHEFWKSEKKHT